MFPLAHAFRVVLLLTLILLLFTTQAVGQLSGHDRDVGKTMLRNIRDEVKKNYFDPKLGGVDLDQAFKSAEESINTATSNGQVFGIIQKALMTLNDTHTYFIPPPRALKVSYDWRIQMIGDQCYILAVKPGSDAEAKGLKSGDILHVVDGYKIGRDNFWLFNYLYNALQPKTQLSVVVQSPGEKPRRVDYTASTRQAPKILDLTSGVQIYDYIRDADAEDRVYEHRTQKFGDDLYIWKMPQFDMLEAKLDDFMKKMNGSKALIIDLRGNGGGYIETLKAVISNLFDRDIKIGDKVRRGETKPETTRSRGGYAFAGKLILLVDNGSGSCSEILSRVVQLEKRGVVIGDVTAGAVMESRGRRWGLGESSMVIYGVSVTHWNLLMTDGKSLEHVGVTPDKLMLPTGADLAGGEDPVLSYAASLAGVTLSPKDAGGLFPMRWKVKP